MKVTMVNSVGEYVAGTEVELEDGEADRFILLGYATGDLTREYTEAEREALATLHQNVSV